MSDLIWKPKLVSVEDDHNFKNGGSSLTVSSMTSKHAFFNGASSGGGGRGMFFSGFVMAKNRKHAFLHQMLIMWWTCLLASCCDITDPLLPKAWSRRSKTWCTGRCLGWYHQLEVQVQNASEEPIMAVQEILCLYSLLEISVSFAWSLIIFYSCIGCAVLKSFSYSFSIRVWKVTGSRI